MNDPFSFFKILTFWNYFMSKFINRHFDTTFLIFRYVSYNLKGAIKQPIFFLTGKYVWIHASRFASSRVKIKRVKISASYKSSVLILRVKTNAPKYDASRIYASRFRYTPWKFFNVQPVCRGKCLFQMFFGLGGLFGGNPKLQYL
jgi:hypothetical protein